MHYLELLSQGTEGEGKSHQALFYPRYTFLMVANLVFLRRNEEAILLMENLLYNGAVTLGTKDQLTAQFGLGFNYFTQGAFGKANRVLMSIKRSDKWCEVKMGREWVLKKNLGEIIIQYELNNEDLALNKIRAVERNFDDLLSEPSYKNVKQYLQLIKYMIEHPEAINSHEFMKQVESRLELTSFENADIQAMSFFAWLKSKMQRRPYYHVLLELAKSTW